MVVTYLTPGIHKEEVFPTSPSQLATGVPAFLGRTEKVPEDHRSLPQYNRPQKIQLWAQYEELFGASCPDSYLAEAVQGFFLNGGLLCYVVPIRPPQTGVSAEDSLNLGLAGIEGLDQVDLVCTPDVVQTPDQAVRLQQLVLTHCEQQTGDRFAILDGLNSADLASLKMTRQQLYGNNGALYFPWVKTISGNRWVPPCGHIAGVYARTDRQTGVFKAPANARLEGVLDLAVQIGQQEQGPLNEQGINCLRVFPGRGIRIWGARTLSRDPAWTYINARRLFLTAGRWFEHNLSGLVYEPNDPDLWVRIQRELTVYFNGLFQQGALRGASAAQAFYIKCDAETNPPEVRNAGKVITEIGLAPVLPGEFIVVRLIHGARGISIVGPTAPE